MEYFAGILKRSQNAQNQRFCKLKLTKLCKIMQKISKICRKICIYQKKVLSLQRVSEESRNEHQKVNKKNNEKMKATTALKNLEKVANDEKCIRNWKLTAAWKLINQAIMCGRNSIRPCYYSGRGRFTSKLDYTAEVKHLLEKAGIRYTLTNDAPRGSETGNLIIMTHIDKH